MNKETEKYAKKRAVGFFVFAIKSFDIFFDMEKDTVTVKEGKKAFNLRKLYDEYLKNNP